MADIQKHKLLNAARALRVSFSQHLIRWSANKNAPNTQVIQNKKVNVPHVMRGVQIKLTRQKGKNGLILYDGKIPNQYAKTAPEALLKDFAETHTKFMQNYEWSDLWATYKEVNHI